MNEDDFYTKPSVNWPALIAIAAMLTLMAIAMLVESVNR